MFPQNAHPKHQVPTRLAVLLGILVTYGAFWGLVGALTIVGDIVLSTDEPLATAVPLFGYLLPSVCILWAAWQLWRGRSTPFVVLVTVAFMIILSHMTAVTITAYIPFFPIIVTLTSISIVFVVVYLITSLEVQDHQPGAARAAAAESEAAEASAAPVKPLRAQRVDGERQP